MASTIYFTTYSGDNRNLDKWDYSNTSPKKTFTIYEMTSIQTPVIVIDYDANVYGYNYCYVDTFARYFYITDIAVEAGKRMVLSLAVDVLNTYKNEILNCPMTIIRAEKATDSYIVDSSYPFDSARKWNKIEHGPETFKWNPNARHYVLGVNGTRN